MSVRSKELKRAPSAYNLYCSENAGSRGLKETAQAWKELSPEQKKPFETRAEQMRRSFMKGNKVMEKRKGADGKISLSLTGLNGEEVVEKPIATATSSLPQVIVHQLQAQAETKKEKKLNVYHRWLADEETKAAVKGLKFEERKEKLKKMWAEVKAEGKVQLKNPRPTPSNTPPIPLPPIEEPSAPKPQPASTSQTTEAPKSRKTVKRVSAPTPEPTPEPVQEAEEEEVEEVEEEVEEYEEEEVASE